MNHYDVIFVSDFRYPGGTATAIAAELRALCLGGRTVALYHVETLFLNDFPDWNLRVSAFVDRGEVTVLAADAEAQCTLLFIHNPGVFLRPCPTRPRLRAALRILVAHHAPLDANGRLCYDPVQVDRNAERALGGPIVWAPISSVCRRAFAAAGARVPLLAEDWPNIVFVDDWGQARSGLIGPRPVIGRHSRWQLEKWPGSREALLKVYPDCPDILVRLLGVGDKIRTMVGEIPANWVVFAFNEVPVATFLQSLDFFVYFHRSDLLETFGLTIAEAAAAGCVVIVAPYLEQSFGDAALYCEPDEAVALVRTIAADPPRFAALSAHGREAIRRRFGEDGHDARIQRLMSAAYDPVLRGEMIVEPERTTAASLRLGRKRLRYYTWEALLASKAVRRPRRKLDKLLRRLRGAGPAHGNGERA